MIKKSLTIRLSGKTAKNILIFCGAQLTPFDIQQLRELTAYDELELGTVGDRKSALFIIISDTDDSSIFGCHWPIFSFSINNVDAFWIKHRK